MVSRHPTSQGHAHAEGHAHGPGVDSDRRYLLTALALLAAFMVAEVITAVLPGSLALLSDAGHIRSRILAVPHVRAVHDLHAWTVTSGLPTCPRT